MGNQARVGRWGKCRLRRRISASGEISRASAVGENVDWKVGLHPLGKQALRRAGKMSTAADCSRCGNLAHIGGRGMSTKTADFNIGRNQSRFGGWGLKRRTPDGGGKPVAMRRAGEMSIGAADLSRWGICALRMVPKCRLERRILAVCEIW